MDTINTDLLRGRVDIFVLNSLSEKDGYGYDILNYIQARTEGHYEMKQSSVYSVLKRLEKSGHIRSYWGGDDTNGAQRRYYSLTDKGREVLETDKKEWAYTRTLIDNLVSEKKFDLKNEIPPFRPSDLRPLTKRAVNEKEDLPEENDTVAAESVEETVAAQVTPIAVTAAATTAVPAAPVENEVAASVFAAAEFPEPVEEPVGVRMKDYSVNAAPQKTLSEVFGRGQPQRFSTQTQAAPRKSLNDAFAQHVSLGEAKTESPIETEKPSEAVSYKKESEPDFSEFFKIKERFLKEGFRVSEYDVNAKQPSLRYQLVNKLYRDAAILTYMFFIVCLLVVYILKGVFFYSLTAFILSAVCGLALPGSAISLYRKNPHKRQKENIKPKLCLNVCVIAFLAFFMLNLIVALLIPNGSSLNTPKIYVPSVYALSVPFFGICFNVLYKTDNYLISKNVE